MTELLCPCGQMFQADIDEGAIAILCLDCAFYVGRPKWRPDAPCWRGVNPPLLRLFSDEGVAS